MVSDLLTGVKVRTAFRLDSVYRHNPELSQRRPPVHWASVVLTFKVQVPLPHEKQLSLQALLQQAPSTQNPVAHSPLLPHFWPNTFPHFPEPSHMRELLQPRGSTALRIGLQVPPPQFWQAPLQAPSQQIPDTQWEAAH